MKGINFNKLISAILGASKNQNQTELRQIRTSVPPELAYVIIKDAIRKMELNGNNWTWDPQDTSRLHAKMKFSAAGSEIGLIAEVAESALGGSDVTLQYELADNTEKVALNQIIRKSSRYIGMALVEAEIQESLDKCPNGKTSSEVMNEIFGDEAALLFVLK